MTNSRTTPRMLEGIRVVDLTSVVFGPYATQILADLGADVVKVEPPTGDGFRYSAGSPGGPAMSPGYLALNRGKRSISLNLKDPADLKVMQSLLQTADVFIHNVRAKAIERLGLSYEVVKTLKPDIIYVHCVGFGSNGPYADRQAYDDVIQAATGATTLASRVDGDPRPRYVPSLIADKVAGMHGGQAVLAALVHRLRTGEGQHVEVPMFEAFAHFMLQEHLGGLTFDPPFGAVGYARQIDPHRQPFPTSDGYLSVVPYTDDSLFRLFDILGAPEVLKDPQFSTVQARWGNISQIYQKIGELTVRQTTQYWMDRLQAAQIPAMPVRDIADILGDPHLQASGFFALIDHPTEGRCVHMRQPIRYGAAPSGLARPAPTIGQDSQALRADLEIAHDRSH